MMRKLVGYFILLYTVFLTGCSVHTSKSQYPTHQLKKVKPQYVAVQHGQIEYYRFGKGSPVVLIAGYETDVTSWNRQFLAALAEHHDVIVFNNRQVAGSVIHSNHYTSHDLANDTHQLIKQLHLQKPAIVGISMGGMIAQQVAASYQNELGSLILINTAIAGKQSVHPTPTTEKLMLNMPTDQVGRYLLAIKLFFPSHDRLPMAVSLAIDRFQPATYTEIDAAALLAPQRAFLMSWMRDDATAAKLKTVRLPTLILNGQYDAVIPPVNSVILANTIPNAELKRWSYGGHAMIFQYPDDIAQAIHAFVVNRRHSAA